MQVTGYIKFLPIYAASICSTCATYPRAVATASSVTSLCSDMVSGGAGSVGFNGIGNGTSKIVYSKSGGEYSSIGNIVVNKDKSDVRVESIFAWSSSRRFLFGHLISAKREREY